MVGLRVMLRIYKQNGIVKDNMYGIGFFLQLFSLCVVCFIGNYGKNMVMMVFLIILSVGLLNIFRRLIENFGLLGFRVLFLIWIVCYKVMYMKYSSMVQGILVVMEMVCNVVRVFVFFVYRRVVVVVFLVRVQKIC